MAAERLKYLLASEDGKRTRESKALFGNRSNAALGLLDSSVRQSNLTIGGAVSKPGAVPSLAAHLDISVLLGSGA